MTQTHIRNVNEWKQYLRTYGGPIMVERQGRLSPIRRQHAMFAVVNETTAHGFIPVIRTEPENVVIEITLSSNITNM